MASVRHRVDGGEVDRSRTESKMLAGDSAGAHALRTTWCTVHGTVYEPRRFIYCKRRGSFARETTPIFVLCPMSLRRNSAVEILRLFVDVRCLLVCERATR